MARALHIVAPGGPEMQHTDERDREDLRKANPTLHELDKHLAVLSERMTSLTTRLEGRFDVADRKMDDVIARYATKEEVGDLRKAVEAIQSQISWAIKIIVGLFLTALVGLLISKSGVPRV